MGDSLMIGLPRWAWIFAWQVPGHPGPTRRGWTRFSRSHEGPGTESSQRLDLKRKNLIALILLVLYNVLSRKTLTHKETQMMQQPEVTPSPDWARFQGILTSCLAKLVELYRDAMQEDPGDYDWSVLVKTTALGQVNEEIPPQVLLERVKQHSVGQNEALLEYDTSWLGHALEGLWACAKLYLDGSTMPAALVHRIEFEEEDAKSPLNEDYEEVNDERSLGKNQEWRSDTRCESYTDICRAKEIHRRRPRRDSHEACCERKSYVTIQVYDRMCIAQKSLAAT